MMVVKDENAEPGVLVAAPAVGPREGAPPRKVRRQQAPRLYYDADYRISRMANDECTFCGWYPAEEGLDPLKVQQALEDHMLNCEYAPITCSSCATTIQHIPSLMKVHARFCTGPPKTDWIVPAPRLQAHFRMISRSQPPTGQLWVATMNHVDKSVHMKSITMWQFKEYVHMLLPDVRSSFVGDDDLVEHDPRFGRADRNFQEPAERTRKSVSRSRSKTGMRRPFGDVEIARLTRQRIAFTEEEMEIESSSEDGDDGNDQGGAPPPPPSKAAPKQQILAKKAPAPKKSPAPKKAPPPPDGRVQMPLTSKAGGTPMKTAPRVKPAPPAKPPAKTMPKPPATEKRFDFENEDRNKACTYDEVCQRLQRQASESNQDPPTEDEMRQYWDSIEFQLQPIAESDEEMDGANATAGVDLPVVPRLDTSGMSPIVGGSSSEPGNRVARPRVGCRVRIAGPDDHPHVGSVGTVVRSGVDASQVRVAGKNGIITECLNEYLQILEDDAVGMDGPPKGFDPDGDEDRKDGGSDDDDDDDDDNMYIGGSTGAGPSQSGGNQSVDVSDIHTTVHATETRERHEYRVVFEPNAGFTGSGREDDGHTDLGLGNVPVSYEDILSMYRNQGRRFDPMLDVLVSYDEMCLMYQKQSQGLSENQTMEHWSNLQPAPSTPDSSSSSSNTETNATITYQNRNYVITESTKTEKGELLQLKPVSTLTTLQRRDNSFRCLIHQDPRDHPDCENCKYMIDAHVRASITGDLQKVWAKKKSKKNKKKNIKGGVNIELERVDESGNEKDGSTSENDKNDDDIVSFDDTDTEVEMEQIRHVPFKNLFDPETQARGDVPVGFRRMCLRGRLVDVPHDGATRVICPPKADTCSRLSEGVIPMGEYELIEIGMFVMSRYSFVPSDRPGGRCLKLTRDPLAEISFLATTRSSWRKKDGHDDDAALRMVPHPERSLPAEYSEQRHEDGSDEEDDDEFDEVMAEIVNDVTTVSRSGGSDDRRIRYIKSGDKKIRFIKEMDPPKVEMRSAVPPARNCFTRVVSNCLSYDDDHGPSVIVTVRRMGICSGRLAYTNLGQNEKDYDEIRSSFGFKLVDSVSSDRLHLSEAARGFTRLAMVIPGLHVAIVLKPVYDDTAVVTRCPQISGMIGRIETIIKRPHLDEEMKLVTTWAEDYQDPVEQNMILSLEDVQVHHVDMEWQQMKRGYDVEFPKRGPPKVCSHFRRGKCEFGLNCILLHVHDDTFDRGGNLTQMHYLDPTVRVDGLGNMEWKKTEPYMTTPFRKKIIQQRKRDARFANEIAQEQQERNAAGLTGPTPITVFTNQPEPTITSPLVYANTSSVRIEREWRRMIEQGVVERRWVETAPGMTVFSRLIVTDVEVTNVTVAQTPHVDDQRTEDTEDAAEEEEEPETPATWMDGQSAEEAEQNHGVNTVAPEEGVRALLRKGKGKGKGLHSGFDRIGPHEILIWYPTTTRQQWGEIPHVERLRNEIETARGQYRQPEAPNRYGPMTTTQWMAANPGLADVRPGLVFSMWMRLQPVYRIEAIVQDEERLCEMDGVPRTFAQLAQLTGVSRDLLNRLTHEQPNHALFKDLMIIWYSFPRMEWMNMLDQHVDEDWYHEHMEEVD